MVEKKLKESYCTQMKIAESRNGDMDIIKPKCLNVTESFQRLEVQTIRKRTIVNLYS